MKTRPTFLQKQIDEVNLYLEKNLIDSEYDNLFNFFVQYLTANQYYRGYNFFKYAYDEQGNKHKVLAGTANATGYDFLQIM